MVSEPVAAATGGRRTASGPPVTGIIHVHSDYSHDGRDSLERLREFALERGIGFVGLTDHAEDLEPEDFEDYLDRCRALTDERVQLFPGLEFRFAGHPGLHLLALGLTRWIAPGTPEEFVAQAPDACLLTIVAHPILTGYEVPDVVLGGVDAIEVWNAGYNTRWLPDPRAIRLLHRARRARPEIVGTAGLDQHDSRNDREVRVVVQRGGDGPLRAIKAGRFLNRGRTMSFDPAVSWSPARLAGLSVLRWGFDRLERVQDRLARALR